MLLHQQVFVSPANKPFAALLAACPAQGGGRTLVLQIFMQLF